MHRSASRLPLPAASSSEAAARASGWHLPGPSSPDQDSKHPGRPATETHSEGQRHWSVTSNKTYF